MGPTIIARNYAETLLELAERHGGEPTVDRFGEAIDEVAELLQDEPSIRDFLGTPRVGAADKQNAVITAFQGRVPDLFLRFMQVVIEKRRQGLFTEIAQEYRTLVDERRGRMRAEITLSHPPTPELEREIVSALERRVGRTIVPEIRVDPALIGGVIIRVGDQILDGSFRRRISTLRRRLAEARLPQPVAG